MAHLLQGANSTSQWFQDSYPGAEFFDRLDKFCLHTTETESWPSYSGGESAPNATYYPRSSGTKVRQHFYSDRSSRALRDPSDTAVRENRDNIFQLEIVAYSDYALAQSVGGLWIGDLTDAHYKDIADMILELHLELDLPIQESVEWHEGRKTSFDDVRLTGSQFDSYKGILGHCHVSGNTHWDPGGFYISKLMATLEGDPVPCPLTNDEAEKIASFNWDYNIYDNLRDDIPRVPDGTFHDAMAYFQILRTQLSELRDDVDALNIGGGTVDVDAIAEAVVQKLLTDVELSFRPYTP